MMTSVPTDPSRADQAENLFGGPPRDESHDRTSAGADNANATAAGDPDDTALTQLHPNYKLMLRIKACITGLILVIAALVGENALAAQFDLPFGVLAGPIALFALFLIIRLPTARYNARGYQMSDDRLRVVRGVLWHYDTIVPFGRVQHIDVDQGPVERALGIATMTLHTAGTHNASVVLPGLGHGHAGDMREEIRAHIKRESV